MKIAIGDAGRKIIAQAESKIEPVEPVRSEHREIILPERAVVEPRLVFHIAGEQT
jgi:hypothetical protein